MDNFCYTYHMVIKIVLPTSISGSLCIQPPLCNDTRCIVSAPLKRSPIHRANKEEHVQWHVRLEYAMSQCSMEAQGVLQETPQGLLHLVEEKLPLADAPCQWLHWQVNSL